MFTAQKCKLFFNDPKFQQITKWNDQNQEAAVNKIFAGQRKTRRSKISYKTAQQNQEQVENKYLYLDFLQQRINSYEQKLVIDVQQMNVQKQRIKDKYSEAQSLYQKANRKLRKLMINAKEERNQSQQLSNLEAEVAEIQRLYDQNQFLKNMNSELRSRIEKKNSQLNSYRDR